MTIARVHEHAGLLAGRGALSRPGAAGMGG